MDFLASLVVAIGITVCIIGLFMCSIMLVKNENTFRNHMKIIDAIDAYVQETGDYEKAMSMFRELEFYDDTLLRLTDWGCKNILPKESYELIKPYIKERKTK